MVDPPSDAFALLDKLRRVPDEHRGFELPAARAISEYEVPADVLHTLREAGLPARRVDGMWRYDHTDVLNIVMQLDVGSRRRMVLGWWIRELNRPHGDIVTYQLDVVPSCPDPEHEGPCRYSVVTPDGPRIEVSGPPRPDRPVHSLRFDLPRQWPELPEPVRELLDEMADITFLRLPPSLRWDPDFPRATGLGDCPATALILVERAARRGIRARMSAGRTLTPPFSAVHYWAEVSVDDQWVPVDPVLITAMRNWGLCDPRQWTRYRTLGGILARFGDRLEPMVLHDGAEIPCRLMSYRATSATRTRGRQHAANTLGM